MSEIAGTLAGLFEDAPLLGRVFFVSLELLLLASVVALVVKLKLVRTHRLQSLLWCIVLLNALCGLTFRAPLELAVWRTAAQASAPVAPAPRNIHRPSMYDADVPAVVPSPPMVREIASALRAPEGAPPSDAAAASVPAWWRGISPARWLTAGWAMGSSLFLAYLLLERWRLHLLLRRSGAPSAALGEHYRALVKASAAWWAPALRVTSDLESPAIVGVIRPVILVPQWLEREGTAAQWTWTLRHELTHWRHGDTLGQSLRLVVQALFFFHPCAWWAGKHWEEAAELACDRSLLETESDAVGYAQELCELLGMIGKRQRPLMSTGLFASRSHIGRRIELLLADPLSRPARLLIWHRALAAILLVGLLGVEIGVADSRPSMVAPVVNSVAAAKPSKAAAAPGARVLHFPESYSMGTIRINGENETIEARGAVEIPAGASVRLVVNDLGAADLSPLASFDAMDIQELSVMKTPVDDDQLFHIQGLTGLTSLDLRETSITDEGMQYLSGLNQLTFLDLNSTAVGDQGMSYLSDMTAMQMLILNRTNVGDEGLSHIQGMTELNYLDMWMLDVTDEGMRILSGLTNLNELGIEDTLITDTGLEFLEGLQQLTTLNLENNGITDAGLASLLKLPNLTELILADTYISDAGMALLAQFPQLRDVTLPVTIGPEGLKLLEGTALGELLKSTAGSSHLVSVEITGEGRPLPGAHFVLVVNPGPANAQVHIYRTDESGLARLYLPEPPAALQLRAYEQGYVTNEIAWADSPPSELHLDLERASIIGGTVVDTSGDAVPGVAVSIPVLGGHNWDAQEPLPHSVSTDEAGRWTCDVAPKVLGEFWVSLDHPAYATTTYTLADLSVPALRDSSAVLTISDAIGLPGLVVDEEGTPLSDVSIVEMEKWRKNTMRATGRAAKSDQSGEFEIKPIRPGESILKIVAVGFAPIAETVNVTPEMEPIRIVLAKAMPLLGRAVNEAGEPLSGVLVWGASMIENGVGLGGGGTTTDSEGRFQLSKMPGGKIRLDFSRKDRRLSIDDHHQIEDVVVSEKEQVFTVPFKDLPKGITEGRALIERYNDAHSPEKIGHVAFSFRVEDKSAPEAPVKITQFAGIRMAGGEYQETVSFGEDGKGQTPWRHSWDGTTYVHHGHPAPGVKGAADDAHYFVSGATPEPAHLAALDDLLIFVQPNSPTRTYEVVQFSDGVVRLAGEGKGAMTIRFSDSERLFYDEIRYFSESGAVTAIVLASEWSDYNSIAYPAKVETTVFGVEQQKTLHKIEMVLPAIPQRPMVEGITWEIPADGVLTFEDSGEFKTVPAAQLDKALMAKKAYWAALTAWVGQR